jgi:MGT family glycosyltransferase
MRVLVTTHPLSGHFHPLLPIARALRAAGHEVAFATAPDFAPVVERLGFAALPAGRSWNGDPELEGLRDEILVHLGPDSPALALRRLFVGWAARHALGDLQALIHARRPDLLLHEVAEFAGPLAAEAAGVSRATVTFGLSFPAAVAKALIGDSLEPLRERAGLTPDSEFQSFNGVLQLSFAPPSYQPAELPPPPELHFLRPEPFDRTGDEDLPAWIGTRGGRPLVYATLGTAFAETPGVFEAIVDGLAGEPIDVVATVGRDGDPERLRRRASNLRVERYIPNSLLLPHCAALVAHAGYGTAMGGLAAGLPMVLVPIAADQFLHAGRCEALGAARVVAPEQVSPEAIRDAVRFVLTDPGPAQRARALAAEIAALPGAERGVELLEQLVRTGVAPVRRAA